MTATALEQAADILFPADGSRRTLNFKFGAGAASRASAEDIARQVIHAENEIAAGRARKVERID